MREVIIALQSAVDTAVAHADSDPVAMLHAAMTAHTRLHCDDDHVMIVRDGLVHLGSDGRSDLLILVKRYENTSIEIIRAGVSAGAFRPVDATPAAFRTAASLFWTLLSQQTLSAASPSHTLSAFGTPVRAAPGAGPAGSK